jgi:hypothetical protein
MIKLELHKRDYDEMIGTFESIHSSLNVLGQIQKCAGGLSMDNLAGETFEQKAKLERFIGLLKVKGDSTR